MKIKDQKENKNLEYKKEVSKTYLKTVSAFANYNDGEIIFGITDDFNVVGIDNPIEACLNIENQINDSIKPKPDYSLKINDDKEPIYSITSKDKSSQNDFNVYTTNISNLFIIKKQKFTELIFANDIKKLIGMNGI